MSGPAEAHPPVTLDAPRLGDSEILFRWINDPATVRFNAAYRPVDEASHAAWFSSIGEDRSRVLFAIRAAGRLVGTLQLLHIHPVHRSAELTIRIGAETDRGRGYGTAAVKLALRFCWDDLNLQRVWLQVFSDNARAIGAYRKAGFDIEGIQRRAAFVGGRWRDVMLMAVLRPSVG
jgi:RimJ/RimL family protein N-acetyltransferase